MKERSVITSWKVLERTPGGYISKLEITERALDGSGNFTHIYYLEHDKVAKERNDFIDKALRAAAESEQKLPDNIPTAEEFHGQCRRDWDVNGDYPMADPIRFAIEFAKLHLKAQAEAIVKNADVSCQKYLFPSICSLKVSSILNAYPLENIK